MSDIPGNGRTLDRLGYRVDRLEADVRALHEGQPAVIADRLTRLERAFENFREEATEEARGTRRLIIGAAVSIVVSALGIAFTVLVSTGAS